ncbi:hypothetical protein [Massilibacteroides sp.]|uniref:hypothetical protein n=1 Tax=Massilibacteroides sp. TaxID=2034766 RepID=UPI00263998B7|nr:hypothetical protein [Massilibacteroides sp.]MDD4515696.1 hypothetical protein [Massilibacteroides sp.]
MYSIKISLLAVISCLMVACGEATDTKVKAYGWQGEGGKTTEQTLQADFSEWKTHGLDGICYNAGHDPIKHQRAAKVAKANGLEYHAWIPAMLQGGMDSTLYGVNRLGQSAYDTQAYVSYYKFLCPNKEEVYQFLSSLYGKIADIPEVDYVHLDYIRFVDVILARGLWDKYGLVMNEEYPVADYCYCDKCVADFKAASGIDIKSVEDPSTCKEWAQFRCDLITKLVNRLADDIHAKGKKVSAAVFPGPDSYAKKMVRQEWNKWNIDAFFPMNYNDFYLEGAEWVGRVTEEGVKSVNGEKPVYSGLFICHDWQNKADIKDPEGHGLLPSEIETAIRGSMEAGAAGVCLFTPHSMTNEHWKTFEKAIRRSYVSN